MQSTNTCTYTHTLTAYRETSHTQIHTFIHEDTQTHAHTHAHTPTAHHASHTPAPKPTNAGRAGGLVSSRSAKLPPGKIETTRVKDANQDARRYECARAHTHTHTYTHTHTHTSATHVSLVATHTSNMCAGLVTYTHQRCAHVHWSRASLAFVLFMNAYTRAVCLHVCISTNHQSAPKPPTKVPVVMPHMHCSIREVGQNHIYIYRTALGCFASN
jgi:hypothetical protein